MAGTLKIDKAHFPTRDALDLKRGKRLGKYRLEKRLGEGGASEVWKAKDCVEDIHVALKIPLVDVHGRRDNRTLLREVRLVANLRHQHIMPVKNADIIDGYVVLATHLSVGTLEDRTKPMAVRRIIYIILQVLDGLEYAHKNRLVHCDVTPGNIFLFPSGRAALGDFGISLRLKGRMATVDDFGTPGYVAPEQAYGKPTYRSDCFSAALILYEYITETLPRWPFSWPFRANKRLRERTGPTMVKFLKKALAVNPEDRFEDAKQMKAALTDAIPKPLHHHFSIKSPRTKEIDWQNVRRQAFIKRYKKIFPVTFRCINCSEPVDERMQYCPWCGTQRNRFDKNSSYSHICTRCHKGVLPEWRFCPWCYGPGFRSPASIRTKAVRYDTKCRYCGGKIMNFMRYCPWCRRKIRQPWRIRTFPEVCPSCRWSVDSQFWACCPWCSNNLQ